MIGTPRSAAGSGLLVGPEAADPGEALPTALAAVGLVPGVDSLVLLQVPGLREALSAGGAAEGLLPRVDPLVGLQVGQPGEGLPTGPAHVVPPAATTT